MKKKFSELFTGNRTAIEVLQEPPSFHKIDEQIDVIHKHIQDTTVKNSVTWPLESDPNGPYSMQLLYPTYEVKLPVNIKFKRLNENATIPTYSTPGSAGCDLSTPYDFRLPAHSTLLVKLGFAIELPPNHEAQVRSRSGLALKHGVVVQNSPGTVDEDFRGEMCVILHNTSDTQLEFDAGERIAQMVIAPVTRAIFTEVPELNDSLRGSGGFGSTGQ